MSSDDETGAVVTRNPPKEYWMPSLIPFNPGDVEVTLTDPDGNNMELSRDEWRLEDDRMTLVVQPDAPDLDDGAYQIEVATGSDGDESLLGRLWRHLRP